MDEDLAQLLRSLKLRRLREVLPEHLEAAEQNQPSYTEFLRHLLRVEYQSQQMRFLSYRIRRAKLPSDLALESFPWERQPGVQKAVIQQLATLDFMDRGGNIVFVGPTGVGKTGLSVGILLKALEAGHKGLFIKAQDLFDEMYASLADRSSRKLIDRLCRVDLLVIDEMGYLNLRPEQSNIFFKLMEERYGRKSTIITTNLDYAGWFEFLGQKPMVEALLDRLRHRCTTIRIEGKSLRSPSE